MHWFFSFLPRPCEAQDLVWCLSLLREDDQRSTISVIGGIPCEPGGPGVKVDSITSKARGFHSDLSMLSIIFCFVSDLCGSFPFSLLREPRITGMKYDCWVNPSSYSWLIGAYRRVLLINHALPHWCSGKNHLPITGGMRHRFDPWSQEDLGAGNGSHLSSFLPGKLWQRNLAELWSILGTELDMISAHTHTDI